MPEVIEEKRSEKADMTVSLVVPAFNEERNVLPLYSAVAGLLSKYPNYEIIFVDDGSVLRVHVINPRKEDQEKTKT